MLSYQSRDPFYKSPFGAVPANTAVQFRVLTPTDLYINRVTLSMENQDGTSTQTELSFETPSAQGNLFYGEYTPTSVGCHFYSFVLTTEKGTKYIRNSGRGDGFLHDSQDGALFQLTVYDPKFQTPDVFKGGIMYQIFPDRFAFSGEIHPGVPEDRQLRSDWGGTPVFLPDENGEIRNNDYFCGDLNGVRSKLGYLAELGVTCIYFNPIFEAHSNHRYNTADYRKIDPLLGTEQDFILLCAEAKRQGIRVILDGVFSHTGSDSVYFNKNGRYRSAGAYQSEDSPYYKWYNFHVNRDHYDAWWGISTLPAVNEMEPSYLEFICGKGGVIDHWIQLGASGFRLDVADELPDAFIEQIRMAVKRHGQDKLLLGEVWEDATNKISYGTRRRFLLGSELDSAMNYPFKDATLDYIKYGDGPLFADRIGTIVENYPKPALDVAMNSLSTHDTHRALTFLAFDHFEDSRTWRAAQSISPAKYREISRKLKLAMVLQYFLPGIPCVYYGDEVGLQGFRDPFNRGCFPWGHEDRDLREHAFLLGGVRRQCKALATGSLRILRCDNDVCVLLREAGKSFLLAAVNRSNKEQTFSVLAEYRHGTLFCGAFSGEMLTIPAEGFALLGK